MSMIHGMKFIEKYFFFGLLALCGILVLVILFPFLTVLLMGVALSIVLGPLYEWIKVKVLPKAPNWIPALLSIIIFLIILGVPLVILGTVVFKQFQNLYISLSVMDSKPLLMSINSSISGFLPAGFVIDTQKEITNLISSISSNIRPLFTATINTVFMFILMILTLFYFLKDGRRWRNMIIEMSPLEDVHTTKLLYTFSHTINATIKGYLIIAVAQGLLMGIGLALFGVSHPALWGVVAGILSMVPMIGTAFVAVPAIAFLLITGETSNAIGLSIWSLTLVGTIDNFLNPLIIGKKTALPPLIVLFSVLGGIALMGPVGILIGPLSVAMFSTLVGISREGTVG